MSTCIWKEDDDGWAWAGCCNNAWELSSIRTISIDEPTYDEWQYCPFCGKPIEVV